MSPTLTHTFLRILPRMWQSRLMPSMHCASQRPCPSILSTCAYSAAPRAVSQLGCGGTAACGVLWQRVSQLPVRLTGGGGACIALLMCWNSSCYCDRPGRRDTVADMPTTWRPCAESTPKPLCLQRLVDAPWPSSLKTSSRFSSFSFFPATPLSVRVSGHQDQRGIETLVQIMNTHIATSFSYRRSL